MPKGNKTRILLKLFGRLEGVQLMQRLQQDLILISFSISVAENPVCYECDQKAQGINFYLRYFLCDWSIGNAIKMQRGC